MSSSTRTARVVIVAGAALAACPGDSAHLTADTDSPITGIVIDATTDADAPVPEEGTTGGGAAEAPSTRIEQILAALDTAMYECPERSWPDVAAKYRERQVLLASVAEDRGWLWNDQSGAGAAPAVKETQLSALSAEWGAYFNVGVLDDVKTLGISLDDTQKNNEGILSNGGALWPDYAIALAFHEGFHFLSDQDDWNDGEGSRSAAYPEPWEPRYLRAQLKQALLAEVQGEGQGLAAAAYWHTRLQSEYAAEMKAIRSYDCTEGSAEYVSLMMSAIAELGCEAPDEEVLQLASSHVPGRQFVSEGFFFDASLEPYELGVLAGLLLRRDKVAGWELAVENGQAPADQLLAAVAPAPQPDDPAVQAAAQMAVAGRNEAVGAQIEPMLARMQDPAYTRIAVSFEWIAGSFGVAGFYYLAQDPALSEVMLRFSAALATPSQVTIAVNDQTVLAGVATPCALADGYVIVVTVPTAALSLAGGKATANDPQVAFADLAVEPTMDMNNLPWLCPVEAGGANGAPAPQPGPGLHVLRKADGGPTRVLVRPGKER
ncbi:hypothetical protein [Nannocystis sp. SCPEA4]|uniref:hypothetical protein n=1 Tax=Nannocystis sp. SCPEA4 TaxID=2996787 RepID=UPI002270E300|nr:hypothetical protein [Nannocystis sp. SCPEA4]MCY1054588.1 hypothetical protein [Nannocystis sp. SCPEA4]